MPTEPNCSITARPIPAALTMPLRQAVLRPHQRREEMRFEGDLAEATIHLGAFDASPRAKHAQPVGVVTLMLSPMPDQPKAGDWRLRAMAVDPAYQGRGVGRMLVTRGIETARTQHGQRIWCNARSHAIGFYEKLGFRVNGEPFDIPTIGPHVRMAIAVVPRPR